MPDKEEELIKQICQGNQSSFEALFRKYYIPLRNYAYQILKDHLLAEDILQDAFFKLWLRHDQLGNVRNIGGYLRTIVHHECISYLRKKAGVEVLSIEKSTIPEFESLYAEILQYQDSYLDEELHKNITRVIEKLPEKCRIMFTLSRSFGLKNKDIASHFNVTVKAVEKQITKALSIISEEIKPFLTLLFLFLSKYF